MAKVNITKPVGGTELLALLSAFKVENNTYVVFDSEKTGSMGLPIIYVSKFSGGKLEKISDPDEWQNVKNYLKGIISGTNFEYIKIGDNLNADEAFYIPLTLPQASFDIIKSRYIVKEDNGTTGDVTPPQNNNPESEVMSVEPSNVMPAPVVPPTVNSAPAIETEVQTSAIPNTVSTPEATPVVAPAISIAPSVVEETNNSSNSNITPDYVATPTIESAPAIETEVPTPVVSNVAPVMPDNNVLSNASVSSAPTVSVNNELDNNIQIEESTVVKEDEISAIDNNFDSDRETFLKACENMFDALIAKYQKQLTDLSKREAELKKKEEEIEQKLKNASEHLANAEAREQVANIAHDNAQRVMDLSNLMPKNPEDNQAGVI